MSLFCGLLYDILHWDVIIATVIAWIAAVIFAFITNKIFVFNSKTTDKKVLLKETVSFLIARLVSLGFDVLITWLMVDVGGINVWVTKVVSNVVVVILNYIFSKLFIFNNKQHTKQK
ncbi:MAG: GtrA family protein [Acutalibacteraceae bacterium]